MSKKETFKVGDEVALRNGRPLTIKELSVTGNGIECAVCSDGAVYPLSKLRRAVKILDVRPTIITSD